jgi:hypothetical protein
MAREIKAKPHGVKIKRAFSEKGVGHLIELFEKVILRLLVILVNSGKLEASTGSDGNDTDRERFRTSTIHFRNLQFATVLLKSDRPCAQF